MKKRDWIFLALIIAIGAFFRFYLIKQMPGGLFPDEAANGLDVNNILKGHIQPFFARGNGREALFFYLEALSVLLFGRGVWQLNIVPAFVGLFVILSSFLLVKRLYGKTEGLLTAYLIAVGSWAVVNNRTAFRANLVPIFGAMTLYFVVRVIQAQTLKDRYWSAFFAGMFFAGGFYSYIAFRIMGLILLLLVGILMIADRKQNFIWFKEYWKSAVLALGSFALFFSWIGYYFIKNPGSFIGRAGQVSVFNSDLNHGHLLATVLDVTKRSLEAFFINGDTNWRQNISGAPFLSPLISVFFGVSLVVFTALSLRFIYKCFSNTQKMSDLKHLPLVFLFWGMLLPVITTAEGIPHGLRSLGMLPAAYGFAAIGLVYFARLLLKVWHPHWMEKLYVVVAALFLATLALTTYSQYFVYAYNTPENFYAFRSDLTTVSNWINQNPDKEHNFLVLDLFSVQTVDFLTSQTGNPYQIVDPANSPALHLQEGDKVIFTQSTIYDAGRFVKIHKNLTPIAIHKDKFGEFDMIIYRVNSTDSSVSAAKNSDGSFRALNLGNHIYFSWDNLSFDPWTLKIWQCSDSNCANAQLLKENQQNDYFANNDHIDVPEQQSHDYYFEAMGYDASGKLLKDFGIIKVPQYK